jgi:hypothetical protein
MGWIFWGFLFAVFIETFIRVCRDYTPEEKTRQTKTQISLPWYGWGIVGYGLTKKNKAK